MGNGEMGKGEVNRHRYGSRRDRRSVSALCSLCKVIFVEFLAAKLIVGSIVIVMFMVVIVCQMCGELIQSVEDACQAAGQLYHTSCFLCTSCGELTVSQSINPELFLEYRIE